MINGIREINNIIAGLVSSPQLQTYLGTAVNLGSFTQALGVRSQCNILFNNPAATATVIGSTLAMTIAQQSAAVAAVVAPAGSYARPSLIGALAYSGKVNFSGKTLSATLSSGARVAPFGVAGYVFGSNGSASTYQYTLDGVTIATTSIPSIGTSAPYNVYAANGLTFLACYDGTTNFLGANTNSGAFNLGSVPGTSIATNVSYSSGSNLYCTCIPGTASAATATPSNLASWTTRTLPASRAWSSTAASPTVVVALVDSSANGATSADGGATWTARAAMPVYANAQCVYDARNAQFVATAGPGSAASTVHTSPDGQVWTSRSLGATYTMGTLIAAAGGILLTHSAGCLSSVDGINYVSKAMPSAANYKWAAFHPVKGEFVACAESTTSIAYM